MPKHVTREQFHAVKREIARSTQQRAATKFGYSGVTVWKINQSPTWPAYKRLNAKYAAKRTLERNVDAHVTAQVSPITNDQFNSLQREVRAVRQRVENLELAEAKRNRRWFGRNR